MNLPVPFEHTMRRLLGEDYEAFREALLGDPAVSIRLNRSKVSINAPYEPVPWATDGYYLKGRPPFTFDPLFHCGGYYVQEASSMFVEQAVRQHIGEVRVALDLCAAPGGKSTLLRSLLSDDAVLVSNEVMRPRAQVLAENITKWGHPRCIVTSNYPADFTPLGPLFDLILVDAPCSGEGMFRKDEVAVSEWSPENVTVCWQRQREILKDIWPTLRPDGLLVYSTCTFNTEEDEENVRWMIDELGAELIPVDVDSTWGITPSLVPDVPHVYRFLPGRTRGEGFFLAVVRKKRPLMFTPEENGNASLTIPVPCGNTKNKNTRKGKSGSTPPLLPPWGDKRGTGALRGSYTYKQEGNVIIAIPTDMEPLRTLLASRLRLLKAGIALAEVKGRDVIPTHELAMSTTLNSDAFLACELSYADALRYLRREAIVLPSDMPRGVVLVTWRGLPLGFVKNIGNRANNLYPQEWRIRSSHLPEDEVKVI